MHRHTLARRTLTIALTTLLCTQPLFAVAPNPAHWTILDLPAKPVAPNGKFILTLTAQIDSGWHIYAMDEPDGGPIPTQVGLADTDPIKLLSVEESAPRMVNDPGSHLQTGMHTGGADFKLHLQLPSQPLAKNTVLHVQVRYQSCNDHVCLPPRTVAVPVALSSMLR